jgi:large conductance mechanosensitive channel
MLQRFKDFLLRGNLVELAVAFVLGGAFGQVVNSLVSDVLTPLIGAPDFSAIRLGPIALGKFINAVVNFLIVAAAIYFLVVTPMNELAKRRKKEEAPAAPPEPPEEVKLLREILEELWKKA